jgi:RNA polymerase sigma-54 factor
MAGNRQNLTTEQRLQQRLTPLQVQFVRMLEMPQAQAEEEVRRALDEMPALEAVDSGEDITELLAGTPPTDSERFSGVRSDFFAGEGSGYYAEAALAQSEDTAGLYEALTAQLAQREGLPEKIIAAGRYIIGSLDDNGYLERPLQALADDLAVADGVYVDAEDMQRAFEAVRGLDPAGVGAVDLRDCLILQLRRREPSQPVTDALEIVTHYFDLFSKKHFDRIRTAASLTEERLREAIGVITRLNPKPGASFTGGGMAEEVSGHITPDFIVEADEAHKVLTLTMPGNIPRLQVERSFAEDTPLPPGNDRRARDARLFIQSNRQDARNFIRIVEMRRTTLYSVMSAILRLQRPFFLSGDEALIRPMVLRDVAALTGYDLSVISRATQGKYVATASGIYPLKFFFNEKGRDMAEGTTAHSVMARIKELIAGEDKSSPMSDEQITARLADAGLEVARRTVAKYRERLGFPVARLRKEL